MSIFFNSDFLFYCDVQGDFMVSGYLKQSVMQDGGMYTDNN